jgi:hypothetical protein
MNYYIVKIKMQMVIKITLLQFFNNIEPNMAMSLNKLKGFYLYSSKNINKKTSNKINQFIKNNQKFSTKNVN